MASKQLRRENHVTDERKTVVKKDRVPKMTTHFESLAEKARDEQHNAPVHGEKPHQFETPPVGIQVSGSDRMRGEEGLEEETEREKRASQIHAEKEEKEQQAAVYGERREGTGEKENHGGEESQVPSLEEISNLRAKAQQNSTEAIRAAEERYEKSKEKGASALHKAKDYTAKKAVESGKGVAEYTGKVAAEVKDHAIVAGWGATHYTLEKAAEATKAVAGITSSVAGYTGEKVVVAKDKVAGAGKSLAGYAGEKIAAAKDAVVATEEGAAEYAARKKAAAEKELEAKRPSHDKGDWGETIASKEQQYAGNEQWETPTDEFQEWDWEGAEEHGQSSQEWGSSILHAIGETIVEIGQTAKELLVGRHPPQVLEPNNEAEYTEETRAGELVKELRKSI